MRSIAAVLALAVASVPPGAIAAPSPAAVPAVNASIYTDERFAKPLSDALGAFYGRDFSTARRRFEDALAVHPANTLAIAFLNATVAQTPGALTAMMDDEEAVVTKRPKDYLAHVRLGFTYLFAGLVGRDRAQDAREELNAAVALEPKAAAAHTALGIMRENDRSINRAKTEFLAALEGDKDDVLAREHLALIYQVDLKDPQRGLAYVIDVPNLIPGYADIYFHVASLLQDLGQLDAAQRYATRGLETDVGHVGEAGRHGYTLLARIYLDEKKVDDARRVLRASVQAGVDTAYAQTLLRKIDNGDYGKPEASASPSAINVTAPPKPKKKT